MKSQVWKKLTMLLFTVMACSSFAQFEEVVRLSDVQSGSLLFRTEYADVFRPATTISTDVTMDIAGMVARVEVAQTFVNAGAVFSEAVYVFPLPEDAAVDSLTMRIGERVIEGEIQTRAEAQATYEQARAAGQSTSLLEQERPNLFTTSVANIPPGEQIIVKIGYTEILRYDAGAFSLRFPLAITPRYTPGQARPPTSTGSFAANGEGWATSMQVPDASRISPPYQRSGENPVNPVRLAIRLNAGLPLKKLESRYHNVSSQQVGSSYELQLAADEIPADRDFELVWEPDSGLLPEAALFNETWQDEHYALLMLMPPRPELLGTIPPREMILVIDTSGSMSGVSMQQAKAALNLALERLRPQDRFNIVEFDSDARILFKDSRFALPDNIRQARSWLNRLQADGGTEMAQALDLALRSTTPEGFLRQVTFVTDGSVGNEAMLFELIEQQLGDARLFTVGIGSAPNSYFMRTAAEFGRGSYTFIGDASETQEKMAALFSKLEAPALTNLALSLPPGSQVFPAVIPDLYAGEPVLVSVKLRSNSGEAVLTGTMYQQAWMRRLDLSGGGEQVGLSQLWARAAIEDLDRQRMRGSNPDIIREDITALALKHHLVTDYTSLVAVDKTAQRSTGSPLVSEHLPQNMPAGQNYDAIFGQQIGFASTASPAAVHIALSLLLLLIGLYLLVVRKRQALRLHAATAALEVDAPMRPTGQAGQGQLSS